MCSCEQAVTGLESQAVPDWVTKPTGRLILLGSVSSRSVDLYIPDVCTRSSHHSALGMSLPQTKSLHVAVCFPTGRLILRGERLL